MASLSFDNLSSEHFGFWFPIKLKLTPSTIHYNSGMSKTAMFVLETLQQLDEDEGFRKFMPSMKVSVFYEGVNFNFIGDQNPKCSDDKLTNDRVAIMNNNE